MIRIKVFNVSPVMSDETNEKPINEWLASVGEIEIIDVKFHFGTIPGDTYDRVNGNYIILYRFLK